MPLAAGTVTFEGQPVRPLGLRRRPGRLRGLQMVFQDPYESLNPRRKVGDLIADGVLLGGGSRGAARARAAELLDRVGLPATAADGYPHEFSGGQRQRIAIARTLAARPSCLIADEPISALDASAQAQVANLLTNLVREEGIGAAAGLPRPVGGAAGRRPGRGHVPGADRRVGRHRPRSGPARATPTPRPWSAAIPRADGAGVLPADLPGDVPDPASPPSGCRFHPRCPAARDDCAVTEQLLVPVAGREVACHVRVRHRSRRPGPPRGIVHPGGTRDVAGQRARGRRAGRRACCPAGRSRPPPTAPSPRSPRRRRPACPAATVTDVAGRWLLPGLISCHTHLSVVFPFSDTDEAENPALTAYRSAARATAALRAGITTIRCVHEQNRADLLLREAAARGWISAPRILGPAGRSPPAAATARAPAAPTPAGEDEFYAAALAELGGRAPTT